MTPHELLAFLHTGRIHKKLAIRLMAIDDESTKLDHAIAVVRLAERTGRPEALAEAVELLQTMVGLSSGHPERVEALTALNVALGIRFENSGNHADLTESIEQGRAALAAGAHSSSDRARYLSNLGSALRLRFEWLQELDDLNQAVTAARDAVRVASADDPDRPLLTANLSSLLWKKADVGGRAADLDEAIRLG